MNKLTAFLLPASMTMVSGKSIRGQPTSDVVHSDVRRLEVVIEGECTVANFAAKVTGGQSKLATLFGVDDNVGTIQVELDKRCNAALAPTRDLSVAIGEGPQFLKNFLDGGTTWNDNYEADGKYVLADDAAIITTLYDTEAKNTVFATPDGGTSASYPQYFSNFFNEDKECRLGVIECCYTASRTPDKDNIPGLVNNAQMCALDLTLSAKSNHIQSPDFRPSFTFYGTKEQDDTYCSAFAYDEGSFGDKVKYNTLFYMAMKTNLMDKMYVKNIPGAPMCGCLEQMPVVDNAACVKEKEGYTIDETTGDIGVSMDWEDCGTDLYSYYEDLPGKGKMEKFFVKEKIVGGGNCDAAAVSFMNEKMYKKKPTSD